MIILFSGRDVPSVLSELHIEDAETSVKVPVGGLTGYASDFLQAQTLCYAPLEFSDPELALTASTETLAYWGVRKSTALLRVNFSVSGANAVIRPIYWDDASVVTIGTSVTLTAIAHQDGTAYMSPVEFFNFYGAAKISFVIDSISAGTVDISVAGV